MNVRRIALLLILMLSCGHETPRRTADIRIIVTDTSKAMETITRSVEAAGGYVSASNMWRDGKMLRAQVTLHVPAHQLTTTLATIRNTAKRVEKETIRSVSCQYE